MQGFLKNNKSIIIHFFVFFLSLVGVVLVLYQQSTLRLSVFFLALSNILNTTSTIAFLVLILSIILLFSENRKTKKEISKIHENNLHFFRIAEQNRVELKSDVYELKGLVKNMDLAMKVKIFNHIDLQKKLLLVLNSINFNRNKIANAEFISFFEKVIRKVANYATELKKSDTKLDFQARKELKKQLENLLISEHIQLNTINFLELLDTLMKEFVELKKEQPKQQTTDLISDKFKVFVENMYEEYTNQNQFSNNNIHINGNDNNAFQHITAENISINLQK